MKRLRVLVLALAVVGALALAVGVALVRRRARLRLVHVISACSSAHGPAAGAIRFSPDGRLLAVASSDSKLRLFAPSDGSLVWSADLQSFAGREDMSFSPAGDQVAIITARDIRRYATRDGALVGKPIARAGGLVSVSLAGDMYAVRTMVARTGPRVRLFSLSDGAGRGSGRPPTASELAEDVAFSPRGDRVAIRWTDSVVVASTAERKRLWLQTVPGPCEKRIHFSPSGDLVAFWVSSGLRVVHATDGSLQRTIALPECVFAEDFAFSPDEDLVATACVVQEPVGDSLVQLWSIHDGRCVALRDIGHVSVSSVAFSPDGQTLAVSIESHEGEVRLYATPR